MANRICDIEGCYRKHMARGWCQEHYDRARRFGRTPRQLDPIRALTVSERLAARSKWQATPRSAEIGDCLVWTGYANPAGYGKIGVGRRVVLVHRAAWIERYGAIPAETPCVLHRCDNPPCWRDEHLLLGTQIDNLADMRTKDRARWHHGNETHCPHGHPYDEANTYVLVQRNGRPGRGCRACRGRPHRRTCSSRPRSAGIAGGGCRPAAPGDCGLPGAAVRVDRAGTRRGGRPGPRGV